MTTTKRALYFIIIRRQMHHVGQLGVWGQPYLGVLDGNAGLSLQLRGGEAAMVSVRKKQDQPPVTMERAKR